MVKYTTIAATAAENKDFIPQTGTLTMDAGQITGYIDVQVTGDSLRQDDKVFYVQLSDPVNTTLSTATKATGTIQSLGTYLPVDGTGYSTPATYPGYRLVWNEEFNGAALNQSDWNFESGGSGWGNHELENYTSSSKNLFLSNGYMIIEARKENLGANNYTSARINTAGKKQFQYGRIDVRAKLPTASGLWPAIWMLGADFPQVGWPGCGETDIMELIGRYPKRVVGSVHWKLTDGSAGTINNKFDAQQDFSQQFHVFSLVWKQDNVQILVDDQAYMTVSNANITNGSWPFNKPSFLICNVAVGGDWPGPPDTGTVFPQRMYIDYIRVFQ
ncbi:MAG: hypothetical protein NVSMB63_15720 [Sediminibacterium sp.]